MAEVTQRTEEAKEAKASPGDTAANAPQSVPDATKRSSAVRKKRARRRKVFKTIITLIILFALIGGITYGMYKLFREDKDDGVSEAMTAFISRGSIQSTVTGGGQAMPRESTTITLTSSGTVLEVYVKDGDIVREGDPLYTIDSSAAYAAVEDAQKAVNNIQKQIDTIVKSYDDLIVRADFSGTLSETLDLRPGDTVSSGTIATLFDDSRMKLELEFSYAYENMISIGQAATVSIPKTMSVLNGVVTDIHYTRRITTEGSALFRAVIEVENPGTLTEKMEAAAVLYSADGLDIYPYAGGELKFSRSEPVRAKTGGTVLSVNLMDYTQVKAGQVLLEIDAVGNDEAIEQLQTQMEAALEKLSAAQKNLENFNASSPMSGTVLSCMLKPGESFDAGKAAISIANTASMVIEARIDEMNVAYVKPGMMCQVTQYGRDDIMTFMGLVESVSLEGTFEGGVSYFPAVISVDNPDGSLMSGMYVEYNLVASQSEDCLLAPVQAVKYTGEGVCLFVKADAPPPTALDAEALGIEIPVGFYAVPVTIGISDNYNVEILDGVDEMTEVFTQYSTPGSMGGGSMGGGAVVRIG